MTTRTWASPSRTTSAARATSPSTTPPPCGLEKADKEFGYKSTAVEPQDGESDADKVQRLESLAKQGYNPVIGVGFAYAPAVKEAAAKYPKTTFGIVDDEQTKADNVADLVFSEEQASYLAGVAAAKATKSNVVGFVGGVDVPLIHKFEAGYKQGVEDTKKGVTVKSQYLTETAAEGGFSSPDKGESAAEGQIDAGADVVYAAAGLSGQGVIKAANANKVWAIGVDSDQYKQDALKTYKDSILTSAMKNVEGAVYTLAKSVEDGKPATGVVRGDLANGGVSLSNSNPVFMRQQGDPGRRQEGRGRHQERHHQGEDLLTTESAACRERRDCRDVSRPVEGMAKEAL